MSSNPEKNEVDVDKLFLELLESGSGTSDKEKRDSIIKAFEFAKEAHKGVVRKSGEPYIIHPIAVAYIVRNEIGLGTKSITSALLHDVVEDTDYTVEDIAEYFGDKVASIVEGLTKLSGVFEQNESVQAENFKLLLLTLTKDLRVILIKIADRLHNMRTLNSMPVRKQYKIAAETLFLFAPIAKRLGLYEIKTELEELSFKYRHPDFYAEINSKLEKAKKNNLEAAKRFYKPIADGLQAMGFEFEMVPISLSVYSIWEKMKASNVSFEDINDICSVCIVFKVKDDGTCEKHQCWSVYSLVTDVYTPKPEGIRDWISDPRSNGYKALHFTVFSNEGKAVEVIIRTEEMHYIARKGRAAYLRKQGIKGRDSAITEWLDSIKEVIDKNEEALEFVDQFKLSLFSASIILFTPKGHVRKLPKDSTILDFAYSIHTDLGNQCVGGRINGKLYPRDYVLKSGDMIEVITDDLLAPESDWSNIVITARAKSRIKDALRKQRRELINSGEEILEKGLDKHKLSLDDKELNMLVKTHGLKTPEDLYYALGNGRFSIVEIIRSIKKLNPGLFQRYWKLQFRSSVRIDKLEPESNADIKKINTKRLFYLVEDDEKNKFVMANCCNPIQGDAVVGFAEEGKPIVIHRKDCKKASDLMTKFGDKLVNVEWTVYSKSFFLAKIDIKGIDSIGIVNRVTQLISNKLNVDMREVNFSSYQGVFDGKITVKVQNTNDLNNLISDIMSIKGVESVYRTDIN